MIDNIPIARAILSRAIAIGFNLDQVGGHFLRFVPSSRNPNEALTSIKSQCRRHLHIHGYEHSDRARRTRILAAEGAEEAHVLTMDRLRLENSGLKSLERCDGTGTGN